MAKRALPNVVPFKPRRAALPPGAVALLALLRAVSQPQLRRYCLEQIRDADSCEELAAAVALTRALAAASRRGRADGPSEPAIVIGAAVGFALAEPAAAGRDPGTAKPADRCGRSGGALECTATS